MFYFFRLAVILFLSFSWTLPASASRSSINSDRIQNIQKKRLADHCVTIKKYIFEGDPSQSYSGKRTDNADQLVQQALDETNPHLSLNQRIDLLQEISENPKNTYLPAPMALAMLTDFKNLSPTKLTHTIYRELAKLGFLPAMDVYAKNLREGLVCAKNLEKSEKWLREAADSYFSPAMVQLGILLIEKKTPESQREAFSWIEKAANQGDPNGMFQLGSALLFGNGCTPDLAAAERWLKAAIEKGNSSAWVTLCVLFIQKNSVQEAIAYFSQNAEKNDPGAMFLLSSMIRKEKPQEADFWLEKAANLDLIPAQIELGKKQLESNLSGERQEGLERLLFCAQQGNTDAMYILGNHFQEDRFEAEKWFQAAVSKGNFEAYLPLGRLYLSSANLKKNAQAFQFFTIAAENGNAEAMYEVSLSYALGRERKADPALAHFWLKKSAEKENVLAMRDLGAQWISSEDPQLQSQGFVFLQKAAQLGSHRAMLDLSHALRMGKGCPPDSQSSIQWLRKAMSENQRPDLEKTLETRLHQEEVALAEITEASEVVISFLNHLKTNLTRLKNDYDVQSSLIPFKYSAKSKAGKFTDIRKDIQSIEETTSKVQQLVSDTRLGLQEYRSKGFYTQRFLFTRLVDKTVFGNTLNPSYIKNIISLELREVVYNRLLQSHLFLFNHAKPFLAKETVDALNKTYPDSGVSLEFFKSYLNNQDLLEEINSFQNRYKKDLRKKRQTLRTLVQQSGAQLLAEAQKESLTSTPDRKEKLRISPKNSASQEDIDFEKLVDGTQTENLKSAIQNLADRTKFRHQNPVTVRTSQVSEDLFEGRADEELPPPAAAWGIAPEPATPDLPEKREVPRRLVYLTKKDSKLFSKLMADEHIPRKKFPKYLKLLKNFITLNLPQYPGHDSYLKSVGSLKGNRGNWILINDKGKGMQLHFVRYDGEYCDHGFHEPHRNEGNNIPKGMLIDYRKVFKTFKIQEEDIREVKTNVIVPPEIEKAFEGWDDDE